MIVDDSNNIYMIKGDNVPLYLKLEDNIFESGSIIYLTVKRFISSNTIDLQKIYTVAEDTDTIGYILTANDTKNLSAGNYKYEIKVKDKNDEYTTLYQGMLYLGETVNELL